MCDSWTRKDGDKQPLPVASSPLYCSCSLHPFILLPPPLSAPIFFFPFHSSFPFGFFFHSADHLLPVSSPLPVRGQRDEREEVALSFSHTQSFQDHWPRCGGQKSGTRA